MTDEDQILRDMILNSCSKVDTSNFDGPTEFSLYDTVKVLANKNPDWLKDKFCRTVFAWQASLFHESHVEEVCQAICPELEMLCLEYREFETICGLPLSPLFAFEVLGYMSSYCNKDFYDGPFGSSPVRNTYFCIGNKNENSKS